MNYKKNVLVLLVVSFFVFMPFATSDPSFMVYTPKRDQVFTIGNNEITWNLPDVGHVRIELHKGFDRIKSLDTWIDNTGSFIWVIDEDDIYVYGKDYRIKVLSAIDDNTYGWSEYFTINLYPLNVGLSAIIIFAILLIIVILAYYNKKTHKIQNWANRIKNKLKRRR